MSFFISFSHFIALGPFASDFQLHSCSTKLLFSSSSILVQVLTSTISLSVLFVFVWRQEFSISLFFYRQSIPLALYIAQMSKRDVIDFIFMKESEPKNSHSSNKIVHILLTVWLWHTLFLACIIKASRPMNRRRKKYIYIYILSLFFV